MSSSKRNTASSISKASPTVSFFVSDLPLTPASLLSNTSSNRKATLVKSKSSRERNSSHTAHSRHSSSNHIHNHNLNPQIATPKAFDHTTDNSLILLPPSQTINESLSALAITTSKQLEEVWDELGLSPEDRADQLTDLLSSFKQLCQDKIESEQLVASNYRQTISEYKEEIKATGAALKTEFDESLVKEKSDQTLQDEIMTLEMKLEDMRSVADVARNELTKYKHELVDRYEALGLSLEEKWSDISSDLTRDHILQVRDKVKELDVAVQNRTSAIVQFIQGCQELIIALKYDTEENELDKKIMNSLVESEDGSMTIASVFESETCTGINDDMLDTLKQRLSDLHSEKKRRKGQLNDMGNFICELWEKLHIPKEEQKKFAESINGLGMDTIRKGEEELKRLRELKVVMTGKLILEAREKIQQLWNDTSASEEQRQAFKSMLIENEDEFDDELLTEHEEYIANLQAKLEQRQQLVDLIHKRESILAERVQYEAFQKDPDRLKQRGAAFTKQLIKEEKMARRIKKGLPEYTSRLGKKLKEWVEENAENFLYNGEIYLETMKRQGEEWLAYKDEQMKLKLEKKQKMKSAPLADSTNSRSRPVSRVRAASRGKEQPSKLQVRKRDESRGKMRTESRGKPNTRPESRGRVDVRTESRGRANISRGRATATSRMRARPGGA